VLIAAALVGAVVLSYSSIVKAEFLNYDDTKYVTENPHLQEGLSVKGLSWGLTTFYFSNWHPLVWWSYLLDYQLHGLSARGFHLTNLLWHTASTLMLFAALRRLTGATWPSALAAALFAVHPLNVQSVAWVSERKGVISTFFCMLTLWTYAQYVERPGPLRYSFVCICLALGLMAKQMLVTLPFVLLLLDDWPLRRWQGTPWTRLVLEKLPLLALAVAAGVLTLLAQAREGSITPLEDISLSGRVKNVPMAYLAYLAQAVLPMHLAVLYPHAGAALPLWQAGAALLLLLALTVLALRQAKRFPYLAVGWLWFLGTLVPVIGLLQVGSQARADRYAYVPLVGLYIAASWGLAELARTRHAERVAAGLACLWLLGLCVDSRLQVEHWQNSSTLWKHALAVTSDNAEAHNNLGSALMATEPREAREHFEKAVELAKTPFAAAHYCLGVSLLQENEPTLAVLQFQKALGLETNPQRKAQAHTNLGIALSRLGDVATASFHFHEAVRLDPDSALTQRNLGSFLLALGNPSQAAEHAEKSLALEPNHARTQLLLGKALLVLERPDKAIAPLEEATRLAPDDTEAHRELADAYQQAGFAKLARVEYAESVQLDPRWPEAFRQAAWTLATHPDAAQRHAGKALKLARQAAQATEGRDPQMLDTLAAAYAEADRFPEAVQTAERALARAREMGQRELAGHIEGRLLHYEMQQAYRTPSS
jgi:tetratricopeptide (TPR) repeat protein